MSELAVLVLPVRGGMYSDICHSSFSFAAILYICVLCNKINSVFLSGHMNCLKLIFM